MKVFTLFLCTAVVEAFVSPSDIKGVSCLGLQTGKQSPRVETNSIISITYPKNERRLRLYSKTTADKESKRPTITGSLLSASLLVVLDIAFRRLFQQMAISFPSSLAGCCALFVSLLALPFGQGVFELLSPGASLLAKWLPVFLYVVYCSSLSSRMHPNIVFAYFF